MSAGWGYPELEAEAEIEFARDEPWIAFNLKLKPEFPSKIGVSLNRIFARSSNLRA